MITIDLYILTAIVTTAVYIAHQIGYKNGIQKGITSSVDWFEKRGVIMSEMIKKVEKDL